MKTCVVDGCEKSKKMFRGRVNSRLCAMHHARVDRHGDVNVTHRLGEKDWTSDPTYRILHKRIAIKRGRADQYSCVMCGRLAHEWAYNHQDVNARTDPKRGLTYSTDPDYYEPMCRKCHAKLDGAIKPKRGSGVRGAAHGMSKLTEKDVHEIRSAVAAGAVGRFIAARYGVTISTVSRVALRKTWTHV